MANKGYTYKNPQKMNNGVSLKGPKPLDDRCVINSLEALHINHDEPFECPLYGNVYKGMMTVMIGEDGSHRTLTLVDDNPYVIRKYEQYTDQELIHQYDVDETNITQYWNDSTEEIEQATYWQNKLNTDEGVTTLTKVGNFPEGYSVGDLQQLTISEIIQKLLFEFVVPTQYKVAAATISFKTPFTGTVEAGKPGPTTAHFGYTFTPEIWRWASEVDPTINASYELSKFSSVAYYENDTNSKSGGDIINSGSLSSVVKEGTNGYFYGIVTYSGKDNAKDSYGSDTYVEDGETKYYQEKKSGEKVSDNACLTYKGARYAYSNAVKTYAKDVATAYSHRNDTPAQIGTFTDRIKTTKVFCDASNTVMYLQWPGGTAGTDTFKVWIPSTYKIVSCKAANNTVLNTYDVERSYSGGTDSEPLSNYGTISTDSDTAATMHIGEFKEYVIAKGAGDANSNICITVSPN